MTSPRIGLLELGAIEDRAKAASRGPWRAELRPEAGADRVINSLGDVADCGPDDAVFIAGARQDVPLLVEFARRVSHRAEEFAAMEAEADRRAKEFSPDDWRRQSLGSQARIAGNCAQALRDELIRAFGAGIPASA